jgi:phosphoglycerol transferase MdoB-like AlkP superfamily enzyme
LSYLTRFRPRLRQQPDPEQPAAETAGAPEHDRGPKHPVAARVFTVLAGVLVFTVLALPDHLGQLTPGALIQIPVEGLAVAALLLVLPRRAGRVVAVLVAVILGLLTVLKIVDMGFYEALGRPFDPVIDSSLLRDAVDTLGKTFGKAGAIGTTVGVIAFVAAVFTFLVLAMLRLTRLVGRHRAVTARTVGGLAVVWLACALLGAQLVPGVPVAAHSAAAVAYDSTRLAEASLRDPQVFAAEEAVDAFRDTPGDQLLTALRGKDVIFTFVESYGRSAIEDPALGQIVNPVLDAGTRQLSAAGFASRSAFLTSSTYGGGSWLAHSTLQSGLWINTQQRYGKLVSGNRLTLASAFKRAGWQTVDVLPGTAGAWPEGAFYGYDREYASQDLGYKGPPFTLGTMPDQYTLAQFQRLEYGKPNRAPLMSEMVLTSSHAPWVPVPHLIDWNDVGDGSVFGPMAKEGDPASVVWRSPARIRTAYATTIAYSVGSLISWAKTYGNDNLVLVFLGDHQPAVVTHEFASRDVPVTIVAKDPAVLDRISGWGWQNGLRPDPKAPVWRMDTFRDRFLTAFGPQVEHAR